MAIGLGYDAAKRSMNMLTRGSQQIDGTVVALHRWFEVAVTRFDEAIFPKVWYSKVVPLFACEYSLAL